MGLLFQLILSYCFKILKKEMEYFKMPLWISISISLWMNIDRTFLRLFDSSTGDELIRKIYIRKRETGKSLWWPCHIKRMKYLKAIHVNCHWVALVFSVSPLWLVWSVPCSISRARVYRLSFEKKGYRITVVNPNCYFSINPLSAC